MPLDRSKVAKIEKIGLEPGANSCLRGRKNGFSRNFLESARHKLVNMISKRIIPSQKWSFEVEIDRN